MCDNFKRDLKNALAITSILPVARDRIIEDDAFIQNIEDRFRPHIIPKVAKSLFDLAQMAKGDAYLISQVANDLKAK